MKLLKVSVPNFRNLKNVELTFEPSLKPAVFPIGSENGGGKSTLFQLIFVLLTCSFDSQDSYYVQNFFDKINCENYLIAKIEMIYKNQLIDYTFFIGNQEVLPKDLLSLYDKIHEIQLEIAVLYNKKKSKKDQKITLSELKEKTNITKSIDVKEHELEDVENMIKIICNKEKIVNWQFIESLVETEQEKFLLCKTSIDNIELAFEAVREATEKTYLVSPSTQPFLFIDKEVRKKMYIDFTEKS